MMKILIKNLQHEEINKKNENLSELFDKNLDKYFNEKKLIMYQLLLY